MNKIEERWVVFWCSLLEKILFDQIDPKEVNAYLKKLSQKKISFPNGQFKKPSHSTLKRKLKQYRDYGFEGLVRKKRNDRGKPRAVSAGLMASAIDFKKDQARRSSRAINFFLKEKHAATIKRSTLYRHLKAAGATRVKLGVSKKPVRKRWTRNETHALWVGDFEEGPYVLHDGQVLPTNLSAFIDCHSRFGIEGRYYLSQKLDILIDSLIRAWVEHGVPLALYVDNAKVYHAKALKTACFRLNIQLLYRRPKDPPGGGLIERLFATVQDQFEAEVRAGDILTLEQLNRAFSAWLNVSYHDEVHSEIKQTPRERYSQGLKVIRRVDLQQALACFMRTEERKVNPEFSDIRLFNAFYRVDMRLRGDRVKVIYDPYSKMETVQIHSMDDVYLGKGVLHAREEGEMPKVMTQGKPKHNYLDLLVRKHEQQLAAQAKGIDYRKISAVQRWSFTAFTQSFAHLLGKKEGLGAFTSGELETMKKIYNRSIHITESLLKEAFELAEHKSLAYVGRQLQILASRKEQS